MEGGRCAGPTRACGVRQGLLIGAIASLVLVSCRAAATAVPAWAAVSISPDVVLAQVVNYQVVAGRPTPLRVALGTPDGRWLSGGSVELRFTFLDEPPGEPAAAPTVGPVRAGFVSISAAAPESAHPSITAGGAGVYSIESVSLPLAGSWQVAISGELADGGTIVAETAFSAVERPVAVGEGDVAPRSDTPVIGDASLPTAAIDSRAFEGGAIPDPALHQISIAGAVAAHSPALVVFASPLNCANRLCAPAIDLVAQLATEFADRAAFIHVEIYRDYAKHQLNHGVGDWLPVEAGVVPQPWTFLVGADGSIVRSWDAFVTRAEIEPLLQVLPVQ